MVTIYNARDGFTRREVIERLIEFREEFGECFLSADAPVALVLRDVANLLGLDEEEELPQVLGPEVAEAISEWEHSREWGLSLSQKGRAALTTAPVTEPVG